jgi:hypothetical protein
MKKKMKRFNDGGYTGDDPIVKYRMGMIDAKGNDLTKKSAPEFETKMGENEAIGKDPGIRERAMKFVEKSDEAKREVKPKSTTTARKVVAKAKESLPMPDYSNEDLDRMGMNEDLKPAMAAAPAPAKKKPYIDIPARSNIGMRQFKTMASGGKVKSASARADGCCIRGKTRA